MDLLERKERLSPCDNNEPNRKEIIRNLMRDGLIFFKQNTRLEQELRSAKKAEADLRLKLAKKSFECQRLEQKVALLEYALHAQRE